MMTNYYTLVKIEETADLDTIKKAFRKEITIYHPDNNTSSEAKTQFKLLVEAFEVLSKPEKRTSYNSLLKSETTNKPIVIQQKEDYQKWKKEAKTKSKTYRESSLTELFLLNIFAKAGFEALFFGSEKLIEGIGDTIGDVVGGIFDGL
ncbi:J domain-containing protein [Winogradskyella sp. UBA3174]|uniref:J domain-containing protein n=1 Tax=Winogradskyella sp. UBA3174 TaxID=1947785 RepID=UPI0025FC76FE|nr:J domain-containing protein [Winogradskyella sp. UBA3174]|tara:strand:+ start:76817 stop:77260 length:444 start_codon:yes stop_codon:yes gene_type:complete